MGKVSTQLSTISRQVNYLNYLNYLLLENLSGQTGSIVLHIQLFPIIV